MGPLASKLIFPPLKTNISPENQWLEDAMVPFEMVPFLGDMFIYLSKP